MNQRMHRALSRYGSAFAVGESSKLTAIAAMSAKAFIVGFSYIVLKKGTMIASPAELFADRIILAFAILFLLKSLGLFKVEPVTRIIHFRLAMLSFLYPIGFFLFQIYGIELITASESAIIYALIPVVTLILSAVLIKDQTTGLQKAGVLMSISGIVYIMAQSISQFSSSAAGYGLTFMSLLTIVFYLIYLKKISNSITTLSITYYLLKYATLFIVPVCFLYNLIVNNPAPQFERLTIVPYIWIAIYLSILSTLVTLFLTNYSIKKLSAIEVAVFSNLSPVIGILSGVIILNEPWEFSHIFGGILVFTGIMMSLNFKKEI